MKGLTIALVFLSCLECITDCIGQDFGCPLEDGEILSRNNGLYSHSDPTHSTTVLSLKQDNVQASLQGRVLDVIKSSENLYTVIVRTGEITIAYKHMRMATVTKNQKVEFGLSLGSAQKSDSVGYLLDISIWFGKEGMNASELLPCANRKLPSKGE